MTQQYVSLPMLPMEDIVRYLEIVGGFRKKDDIANDTRKVGFIDSDKIAIASLTPDGELVSDRNTVDNALNLNGLPAENYLTKGDSASLIADTHQVSTIVSDEISALRDELYQIRNELSKGGYLKGSNVYNGFYDPFRDGEIKYDNRQITKIAQADNRSEINDITVIDSSDLMQGEYIIVKSSDGKEDSKNEKYYLTKIIDKKGTRLTIDPKIPSSLGEFSSVYKTLGIYNSGDFVFGKRTKSITTSNEKTAILKDGKIRKTVKELNEDIKGFATTITCPISMPGMLRKLSVSLAAKGNPGAIKASIYRIDELAEGNEKFVIIGESDTKLSAEATVALRDMTFKFNENIKLEATKDYVILLSSTYTDAENKWFIGGYDEPCNDEVHKDCYNYIGGIFNVANETADMFLSLTTNEIIDNQIENFREGLYTCNTDIYNNGFTRVRVELKINREGKFSVSNNPTSLICDNVTAVELVIKDGKSYGSAGIFQTDDSIVIGKQIAKVGDTRKSSTSFTLNTPTYCEPDADCYRMGYDVQVIAKKIVIKTENSLEPIVVERQKLVKLPLVAVIPGKEGGKEDESSDRLIFEAEIEAAPGGYKLLDFNNLEVQIAWRTNGVTHEELQRYPELSGKIFDISIATDTAYNKRDMK